MSDSNWENIIAETKPLFDKRFIENKTGKVYILYGVVYASDDYYYGLVDLQGENYLASCVTDLLGNGFRLVDR